MSFVRKPRKADPVWGTIRLRVLARAGTCCERCSEPLPRGWHCHHRKLRSQGGTDVLSNLLALCPTCHRDVHSRVSESYDNGWLVRSVFDPAGQPVARRGVFVMLDNEGNCHGT